MSEKQTTIAQPSPEDIMRAALRELSAGLPPAKGLDPVSRANLYRNELERRMMRARRAFDDAWRAAP